MKFNLCSECECRSGGREGEESSDKTCSVMTVRVCMRRDFNGYIFALLFRMFS